MALLAGTVQPPLLTLLSSTSSPSLSPLFVTHTDPSSSSSLITTLQDSIPSSDTDQNIIPRNDSKGSVAHNVVHIQSPNIADTYIQAGCSLTESRRRLAKGKGGEDLPLALGVELPWVGMQVKRLGRRHMSFEIGFVDTRGREGVVRCSSFKKSPTVHPYRDPPLIHLPLTLPHISPSQLTPWLHISLDLLSLIPLFPSLPRPQKHAPDDDHDNDDSAARKRRKVAELPSGSFGSVTYVRVYANCRVRRIWFSAEGEKTIETMGRSVKEEWGLYAAET
ncbi:hypothetical protein CI109_104102 [Kwoniella shandongensis]|uniref:CFA20 domain-containing protein n=1 Tax=Kwoniella shandongensis TaxID=1734106 RepID=A0A5M6C116_9TREE|nr:uncharacterized protein CI109_002987 [Kwoniella shandongensis]KAA5528826.1 hypothetical protein CI109_002987 [Kwoniella shandongensis]